MPKTILIVEDEVNLVELLEFRLESVGYRVETAYDGEEGLEKINRIKPDLVILDIMMPKMHGYDVCKRSKKGAGTKDIPIIILTARSQEEDIARAKLCGADSCLSKPFEPRELMKEVEKYLK